jgi:uncharacterized protein with beta-barrel porin domain
LSLRFYSNYTPRAGDSYTLVSATTISGNFATVVNPLANALSFTTTISSDYIITCTAVQGSFTNFATTPNQTSIANSLNQVSGQSGMQPLIDYLNALPGTSLAAAYNRISPESFTNMSNFSAANTQNLFSQLGNRFAEIQNGQRFSSSGLTIWDPSMEFKRNSLLASNNLIPMGTQMARPTIWNDPDFGLFISGKGTFGSVDGDSQNGDPGFNFSAGGMILGADYHITREDVVGVYAGYQGTRANIGNGGTVLDDSARFGIYGSHVLQNGNYLNGSIGGATHSYTNRRAAIAGFADSTTGGMEFASQIEFGHNFKAGEWTFGPTLELAYNHLWIDGFTESGSLSPLAIQAQQNDSLRSTLGAQARRDIPVSGTTVHLSPYVNAGWQHEYMDNRTAISASFANGTGNVFGVDGTAINRDSLVTGIGVQAFFNERVSGNLGYTVQANSDFIIQDITGSMNYRF